MLRPLGLAVLVVAPLLLAPLPPGAAAAPLTVTTASYRVGDVWRVDSTETTDGDDTWEWSWVARIDGNGRAKDAFGREWDTIVVRSEWHDDHEVWATATCHMLAGGIEEVREDLAHAVSSSSYTVPVVDVPLFATDQNWRSFHAVNCDTPVSLAGRTFTEGERLQASEVGAQWRWDSNAVAWSWWQSAAGESAPAVATIFQGRPALAFDFRLEAPPEFGADDGDFRIVVAEGLPGVVAADFVSDDGHGELHDALVGYTPGAGPAVVDAGARLPPAPTSMVPYEALGVEHEAWNAPYTFDDAVAALRADPLVGYSSYLAGHPQAALLGFELSYTDAADAASGIAEWQLAIADATSTAAFNSSRPVLPLALVEPPALNEGERDVELWPAPLQWPTQVVASDAVVAASEAAGLPLADVRYFGGWYYPGPDGSARLLYALSDFPFGNAASSAGAWDARIVYVDGLTGGLFATSDATRAPIAPQIPAPRTVDELPAAPPGPAPVGPLAIAASVTLLALLAFALLSPLYARLARSRVLADPTRARLLARVQREPGIHRSQLAVAEALPQGAARHHIDKLVEHRLLVEVADGGFVRYYAPGALAPHEVRRAALLRSGALREVYDLYRERPETSLREAARRLGRSAPSVHRARRRLQQEGLLPSAAPLLQSQVRR